HEPVTDLRGTVWGRAVPEDALCGRLFSGRYEWRLKQQMVYYYCSRLREGAKKCTARMLRADDAEVAIWGVVADALRHPEKYLEQVRNEAQREDAVRQLERELTLVVARLSELDGERRNVLRQQEKGNRSEEEADARVAEIRIESAPLTERQAALEMQLRSL